jgi:osmotically inducible lipoprotein OsmB
MFRNMTTKSGAIAAVFATALAVAGCGTTPGERIGSGALLGAGGGAAIGSLSGDAGKGAIIGGVAGGALGALTTPAYPRYGYYDGYYYDRYSYSRPYYGSRCYRYSSYTGRCVAWY